MAKPMYVRFEMDKDLVGIFNIGVGFFGLGRASIPPAVIANKPVLVGKG